MVWTSQHSGSCGTISAPNITHFWPHWEWRDTPGWRELDVFSPVAQSPLCVRQVSFPQPLPISPYIRWWCEPRNFTQVISPDASICCQCPLPHRRDCLFFLSSFFDFLPEGWVGVNPELRFFTFLEPFPNWYYRQVYSAGDSSVGDIELSWQDRRQQGASVAVAASLSQQPNYNSISSVAAYLHFNLVRD